MITTEDDARQLLLAAGVPEPGINNDVIQVARLYNEILTRKFAELLAQRITARLFGDDERANAR